MRSCPAFSAQNDNRPMQCLLPVAALALTALAGCTPTLNWREVRLDGADLVALLPCKPDKGERAVPLAGKDVVLRMQGCEVGEATFAVSHVAWPDAAQADQALAQWKTATLANMQAIAPQEQAFVPPGAMALGNSRRVNANGRRANGEPVTMNAAWFARPRAGGIDLFHAVLYAQRVDAEASSAFFSGIRFP
jgi:hypothetical protein